MQHDSLVRMANDIAKFFAVQGEARGAAGVADHIKRFWEHRMKSAIFAHVAAGGEGLSPLALAGIRQLMAAGEQPPAAPDPGSEQTDGNGQRGKAAAR